MEGKHNDRRWRVPMTNEWNSTTYNVNTGVTRAFGGGGAAGSHRRRTAPGKQSAPPETKESLAATTAAYIATTEMT